MFENNLLDKFQIPLSSMESDFSELKKLLRSSTKSNKILSNVILIVIDTFPSQKEQIGKIIADESKNNENAFLSEFLDTLFKHSSEYENIIKEFLRDEKLSTNEQENIELIQPPESIFYDSKKIDVKFREFVKNSGPELSNTIEKFVQNKNSHLKGNLDQIKRVKFHDEAKESVQVKKKQLQNQAEQVNINKTHFQKNLVNKFNVIFPSLQCRICALRFHSNNKDSIEQFYIDHMEQHQKKKNIESNVSFRQFFVDSNGWFNQKSEKIFFDFSFPHQQDFEKDSSNFTKTTKIHVQRKLIYCSLCKNKMNVVWDDDEDSWMIKDGVKLGDEYVHKDCAF